MWSLIIRNNDCSCFFSAFCVTLYSNMKNDIGVSLQKLLWWDFHKKPDPIMKCSNFAFSAKRQHSITLTIRAMGVSRKSKMALKGTIAFQKITSQVIKLYLKSVCVCALNGKWKKLLQFTCHFKWWLQKRRQYSSNHNRDLYTRNVTVDIACGTAAHQRRRRSLVIQP